MLENMCNLHVCTVLRQQHLISKLLLTCLILATFQFIYLYFYFTYLVNLMFWLTSSFLATLITVIVVWARNKLQLQETST